jgi:hypothetical protein
MAGLLSAERVRDGNENYGGYGAVVVTRRCVRDELPIIGRIRSIT